MKRKIPLLFMILSFFPTFGQVGIGTTMPESSAALEIKSSHKGVLIPRIALQNNRDRTTIDAPIANGLLVYNTTRNTTLKEGFYFWFRDHWEPLGRSDRISEIQGNPVHWDPKDQHFSYTDKNRVSHKIRLPGIRALTLSSNAEGLNVYTDNDRFYLPLYKAVKTLETVTTLTRNADGTYTFTNEQGKSTHLDPRIDSSGWNFATSLVFDEETAKLLYTDAKNEITILDLSGLEGNDGLSAYEIAVDNGFQGTEEEW